MDIGSWFQNYFNLNNQSIFQMCLPVGTHIWNLRLNKCKVGPQENSMDAEECLSMISFHTGSESMGVFWLVLFSSPPGKYCQWFVLDWGPVVVCWFPLTILCYVLGWSCDLSIGVPGVKCVNRIYPSSAGWTVSAEQPLFKTLAGHPHSLSWLQDTKSLLFLDVLRPSLWYQLAWFSILGTKKSSCTAASGVGRNSEGGERNLSLDNSWI